jgi:hypothetical protein
LFWAEARGVVAGSCESSFVEKNASSGTVRTRGLVADIDVYVFGGMFYTIR